MDEKIRSVLEYMPPEVRPLYAAAPDLLGALEAAAFQLDADYGANVHDGYWPAIRPLQLRIRAAIKKTRGL